MIQCFESHGKLGRWLACLLFALLWMPAMSYGITVYKFINAVQPPGLNAFAYYTLHEMSLTGAVSAAFGPAEKIAFPPSQASNYYSIQNKYVMLGSIENPAGGLAEYDPINDPGVTNSYSLGPRVMLGYGSFVRTIQVLADAEITVKNPTSQYATSGGGVSFSNTELGTERGLTFQIFNTGSKNLTGIVASIVGSADYLISQSPATTLAPGAVSSVVVRFRPNAAGVRTGALHIASNDRDENPFILTLTGTATGTVVRKIEVRNTSNTILPNGTGVQSFGNSLIQTTVTRTLRIRNAGNVPLHNLAISLGGTHASDFSVDALTSGTLGTGGEIMDFTVRFTPTVPGERTATISVASDDPTNNPYIIQLMGSATGGTTFDSWAQGTMLVGADAEPGAMPFGDGVPNLLKYAFNLDPNGPDFRYLTTGVGMAGLPVFTMSQPGPNIVMRIEYLRRKNSDLIYTPKRSATLMSGSFTPILPQLPLVTSIDAEWERVVMQVSEPAATQLVRFYVVEVTKP